MQKKKKTFTEQKTIVLTDSRNRTLYTGNIYSLPIRNEAIIQKSIDFFDDPEPCTIHRNAVYTRLCAEIELYIMELGEYCVSIDSLPDHLRYYIDI